MKSFFKNKKNLYVVGAIFIVLVIALILFLVLNNNKKYTITFDSDGGTKLNNIIAKENEKITLPTNVKKEGYIFNGWLDKDGKPVNDVMEVISDVTFVASWISADAKTITITFDSDGGTKIDSLTVVKGEELKLPTNPKKSGYTFISWVDKNDIPILDGALLDEDIALKALWEKNDKTTTKKSTGENTVEATSIEITKEKIDMIVNDTKSLEVNISPSNTTDKTLTWTSSDTSIITVDANGKVKAVWLGQAAITVKTSNGKRSSTVINSEVKSISLSTDHEYISYKGNKTSTLNLNIDSNGYSVPNSKIEWSVIGADGQSAPASSQTSGTKAVITARSENIGGTIKVTVSVGNKTTSKTIYAENPLYLTGSGNGVSCYTSDTYKCDYTKETNMKIVANIDVSWTVPDSDLIANFTQEVRQLSLSLNKGNQTGFYIKAKSKGGQSQGISVTAK